MIEVLTHYDDNFKLVGDITSFEDQKYCDRHGYKFRCERSNPLPSEWHCVWGKLELCRLALINDNPDWIMYIDADAQFMNHDIELESLIDDNYDFIVSKDVNGLNSGVFFLRNSAWSLNFLLSCWEKRFDIPNQTQAEQIAMRRYIDEHGENRVKFISPKKINCYLYAHYGYPEDTEGNYEQGDFILHLPGCDERFRVKTFMELNSRMVT